MRDEGLTEEEEAAVARLVHGAVNRELIGDWEDGLRHSMAASSRDTAGLPGNPVEGDDACPPPGLFDRHQPDVTSPLTSRVAWYGAAACLLVVLLLGSVPRMQPSGEPRPQIEGSPSDESVAGVEVRIVEGPIVRVPPGPNFTIRYTTNSVCSRLSYSAIEIQTGVVVDSWEGEPSCHSEHLIAPNSDNEYDVDASYEIELVVEGAASDGSVPAGTGTVSMSVTIETTTPPCTPSHPPQYPCRGS